MTKAELYQKACMLPLLPGVYIIRDKSDTIIYIGKAKRLRIRVSQYFREGVPHDNKVSQMIAHAYAFDVIVCQSEFEALVLEASQIKAHTPKYNILLKDDKGYSYIKITKEEWPRLLIISAICAALIIALGICVGQFYSSTTASIDEYCKKNSFKGAESFDIDKSSELDGYVLCVSKDGDDSKGQELFIFYEKPFGAIKNTNRYTLEYQSNESGAQLVG